MTEQIPPEVLEAIASCTIVGHNLDFDLTVLRRYGITCSSSIVDTMLASRLLGLGKEKFKVPLEEAEDDGDDEDIINPVDHRLAAVVRRYTGIKMTKAKTNLGGCDWGKAELSEEHFKYMREDVTNLPGLWEALQTELRGAGLERVFRERMAFAVHLNVIKMTGKPVDLVRCEEDCRETAADKEAVREELREMFKDYRHPIPKSRRRKIKIKAKDGKCRFVPGSAEEEFSPSNQYHVNGALGARGIYLENLQRKTLQKNDSPECRLLVKYSTAKKRLEAIKAIIESHFPDGRVRPQSWDQLSARTGRMTSKVPNFQNVPKNWRTGFRVDTSSGIWLKVDLSQIEITIIAVVANDVNMIAMIRDELDVYVQVASRIFNVKAERREEEGFVTDQLRDACKPIVLGIDYGLTPFGWVRQIRDTIGLEFTVEEAGYFFEQFFEMFPAIAAYHDKALEDSLTADSVRTAMGTRRYLPPLLEDGDENGYWPSRQFRKRVLLNTPIQGGGADLQVRSVNLFVPKLPPDVQVVNLVHDEADLIVTKETLYPTVEVLHSAFRQAFSELFGDTLSPRMEFYTGQNWGELKKLKISRTP
jgi:DNA polymerase-1